jgi:cytochrome bd-type quinol oxidase subunit 2
MANVAWYWVVSLALAGIIALYLIFRLPTQRWPRVMAVTAAGAIASLFFGDASAFWPILLSGSVLTICSATAGHK